MPSTPIVSIVFATLNRLPFLQRALASIPAAVGSLTYEIIVVDGGSSDGTLAWLKKQRDRHLMVLAQGERLGAVAAFNAGFHSARGEFVAGFNDDAEYVAAPLHYAVELLRSDKHVGQMAIPFLTHRTRCVADIPPSLHGVPVTQNVALDPLGLVPYANFSVMARALGEELGWWSDYYQYGGDTELSVKVWLKGLRVAPLPAQYGYLIHWEAQDETRLPNVEQPAFNARWRSGPLPLPPLPDEVPMHYLGKLHGNVPPYQRPGSTRSYKVDAAHAEFLAHKDDVPYLLSLRERGKRLFARAF